MHQYQKELNDSIQLEWKEKVKNKVEFDNNDVHDVEDYLSNWGVFVNGISGEPSHSDSYMSIIDMQVLKEAIASIQIPKGLLKICLDYWEQNPNVGVCLKMVKSYWKAKIK